MVLQRHLRVPVGCGQQHRQAIGVEPLRDAPRRAEAHAVDQRLQLDEQGPPALARHGDNAAGGRLRRAREKNSRRVPDLLQSARAHGEEAQLVHRAEAVLGGTHDAIAAAGFAFEIQHGVHQVLEQARACDHALLGQVADNDDGGAARLGVAHQLRGALAQLRHCPGPRARAPRLHGLDGIDDQHRRALLGGERQDRRQVRVRHHSQGVGPEGETLRTQAHLGHRLLAARVDHRARGGHTSRDLQEERGLADAGISPQQDHRPRDDAAAQDPVQLRLAAGKALGVGRRPHRGAEAHGGRGRGGPHSRRGALLERVPLAAQRALPLPFEGLAPAGATYEHGIRASHRCAFGQLSARIRGWGRPDWLLL